jgi:hypothetical protein
LQNSAQFQQQHTQTLLEGDHIQGYSVAAEKQANEISKLKELLLAANIKLDIFEAQHREGRLERSENRDQIHNTFT